MMEALFASVSIEISELKLNPTAILEASGNMPVAILNRNKPIGYLLTAHAWEKIHHLLEDKEILKMADARMADGKNLSKSRLMTYKLEFHPDALREWGETG